MQLADGSTTTLHVASFPLDRVAVRVARLSEPEPLVRWCRRSGVEHAIVGGFFVRPGNAPLGELRIAGAPAEHVAFDAPWGARRACVHVGPSGLAIARRPELPPQPRGDLLQAGPLLVRAWASVITGDDEEGFSAGAHQFDSDISDGRHPRCALTGAQLLAVACDGRHADDAGLTLGELRIAGAPAEHVAFDAPWGARRACVHVGPTGLAIARRPELPPQPRGDLLQAGPLLVRAGASVITGDDAEGFSAGAHQFDSDISEGRHPRCALALTGAQLLAVACDGRHADDAGLTLGELADALVGLGARAALNLDGGGSASLVCDGALVNRPREQHGIELLEGRPIATALVIDPLRG